MAPLVLLTPLAPPVLLAASGEIRTDKGIGYGGVDEEGTMDPSARRRKYVWDDEQEKEEETAY